MQPAKLNCAQFAALELLLAAPGGTRSRGDVYAAMQGHGLPPRRIGKAAMSMCELRLMRWDILGRDESTFTITAAGRAEIIAHLLPAAETTDA